MKLEQIKEAYGKSYAYIADMIDKDGFCPYLNDGMIEVGMKPFGNHERRRTVGGYVWRPIQLTILQAKGNITAGGEVAIEERRRQVEDLGYDYSNDELYAEEQLAMAGSSYAMPENIRKKHLRHFLNKMVPYWWPWHEKYWKPTPDNRIRELGKAAALIIAQIDYYLNKKKNGKV